MALVLAAPAAPAALLERANRYLNLREPPDLRFGNGPCRCDGRLLLIPHENYRRLHTQLRRRRHIIPLGVDALLGLQQNRVLEQLGSTVWFSCHIASAFLLYVCPSRV